MAVPSKDKLFFIVFIVLFAIGILYILFNSDGVVKYVKLKQQVDSLQTEIQKVEAANSRLREEIDSLKQKEPAKIEHIAREKYGLIREGEKVYRMKEK